MLLLTWDQFTIDSQTERDGSRRIAFFAANRRISSGILFYILEIAKPSNFTFVLPIILSKHVGCCHSSTSLPLSPHLHHPVFALQKIELQQGRSESAAASSEAPVSSLWNEALWGAPRGTFGTVHFQRVTFLAVPSLSSETRRSEYPLGP